MEAIRHPYLVFFVEIVILLMICVDVILLWVKGSRALASREGALFV